MRHTGVSPRETNRTTNPWHAAGTLRSMCRAMRCHLVATVMLLMVPLPALPAEAAGEGSLREWWTTCLKEYVQHTAYEKFYLEEIGKINKANADSVLPSQLAASYYPMCKMFSERGEFMAEILFARQIYSELSKTASTKNDFLIMAKYANSAGISYTALKFYEEAEKMFDKGTHLAIKHGFKDVLAQIYTNRAHVYFETGNFEKTLDLLSKLKKLTKAKGILYNNIALVYYRQEKMQEALECFDSALHHAAGNQLLEARIYTNKGDLLTNMGRYAEAKKCLDIAAKLQGDNKSTLPYFMIQLNLAQLWIAMGNTQNAINTLEYIQEHVMPKQSDVTKGRYLKEIAGMYIKLGDYTRASRCLQESIKLNDSIYHDNQKRQLFQMMSWHDIAQLRNDNMMLKNEYELAHAKLRSRTIMVVATILVTILLSVLVVVTIKKRKNEQRQNAVIREQEKKLYMLKQKEYEWEKSKMENEIGRKSRELASFSIDLSSIDNLHKNIGDELAELAKGIGDEDARKRINAVSLKLRKQTACRLSEGFKKYFNEMSPQFDSRLKEKHPNLTLNDQRLCAYIYMGLTSKEISQITFREVESVEKSRNRLRKKINLDSNASIREYLSSIIDSEDQRQGS